MSRAEEIKHLLEVSRQMRVDKTWPMTEDEVVEFISSSFEFGFVCGALWKKQQDQSTIELAEDHAMLAGMEKMKEQMMANAIDGEVLENCDGKVLEYDDSILNEKLSKCKVFDKVKVIVIKG